jgi:hypothetical protein
MSSSQKTALDNVYGVLLKPYARLHAGRRQPPPWTRPLRRTAKAVLSVARYGHDVSRHHSVGVARQAAMLLHRLNEGFSVEDFYRYRLYRETDEVLFVPSQFNYEIRSNLYRRLAVDAELLADKRRFARAAVAAGLPTPEMVAEFSDGTIEWWSGNSLPGAHLFAKEAQAMCGQGAMSWSWDGAGWVDQESGAACDEKGLLAHLVELSQKAPYVLQRRLSNHPDLLELSPVGLCTVRVVTFRSRGGGDPRILLCAFRIPRSGDIADNFARGGLACTIDMDTGTLGIAVLKDLHHAHLDLDRIPDTGAKVSGRVLPCWDAVKALAVRAHDCFPQFPSVGWDIAITDHGPVVLEANYNWDSVLAQQVGCCPLGGTEWTDHLLEWAQENPGAEGDSEARTAQSN